MKILSKIEMNQAILESCQFNNLEDLNNIVEMTNFTISLHSNHHTGFELACEFGHVDIVKYIIEYEINKFKNSETYKNNSNLAANKFFPFDLKKMIEKGISISVLNSNIEVLDYLLFDSGADTHIAVKGRVQKLLQMAKNLEGMELIEYLFKKPGLIDKELLKSPFVKFQLDDFVTDEKTNVINFLLTIPSSQAYYKEHMKELLDRMIAQNNIEVLDNIFNSEIFDNTYKKKEIDEQMITKAYRIKNMKMIEYLILNDKENQNKQTMIEILKRLESIDKTNIINMIQETEQCYEKKELNEKLSIVLHTKSDIPTKRKKI